MVAEGSQNLGIERALQQLALLRHHRLHIFFDDIKEIVLDVFVEVRDRQFAVLIDHEFFADNEEGDGRELDGHADLLQQIREDFAGNATLRGTDTISHVLLLNRLFAESFPLPEVQRLMAIRHSIERSME